MSEAAVARIRDESDAIRAAATEAAVAATRASVDVAGVKVVTADSGIPFLAQVGAQTALYGQLKNRASEFKGSQERSEQDFTLLVAMSAAAFAAIAAATAVAINAATSSEEQLALKLALGGKVSRRDRRTKPDVAGKAIKGAVRAAGWDRGSGEILSRAKDADPSASLHLHENPRIGVAITAAIDRTLDAYVASLEGREPADG